MLMFPNACVGGPLLKDGGPPTGGPRLGPRDGGGPRPVARTAQDLTTVAVARGPP